MQLPLAPWAPGAKDHVVCVEPEFVSGRRIVHQTTDQPLPT